MAGDGLQRRQRLASAPALGSGHPGPWLVLIPWLLILTLPATSARAEPPSGCPPPGAQGFDLIVYGDEPAGLLTALALATQRNGASRHPARVAVVREEAETEPLGGTLTRSGLAYLDRNQLPWDQWIWRRDPLAPSSRLYGQFLKLSGTRGIAADPWRSDRGFRAALARHGVVTLSGAGLTGVSLSGRRICSLTTRRYGRLPARHLIDNSLGADLAHLSGVAFNGGMGTGVLAGESLALGWIFELRGLNLERFRALERRLTQRLLDPDDREAQGWLLAWPTDRRHPQALRRALLDPLQQPRVAISWTEDSADQISPALAIAFHGESHIPRGWSPLRSVSIWRTSPSCRIGSASMPCCCATTPRRTGRCWRVPAVPCPGCCPIGRRSPRSSCATGQPGCTGAHGCMCVSPIRSAPRGRRSRRL
ncbi:MAG: FAD-dependent oxidoreductase [Cyanobacteriota bacterium]